MKGFKYILLQNVQEIKTKTFKTILLNVDTSSSMFYLKLIKNGFFETRKLLA